MKIPRGNKRRTGAPKDTRSWRLVAGPTTIGRQHRSCKRLDGYEQADVSFVEKSMALELNACAEHQSRTI